MNNTTSNHHHHSTFSLILLFVAFFVWLPSSASVGADLPSCIRAKCTHCRVPFIAEMCPGACAICGPMGNKIFVTTAQQTAQVPDPRAFGQQQAQQSRVPFAQQLPLPGSSLNGGDSRTPAAAQAGGGAGAVVVPTAQQPRQATPQQQQQQQRQLTSRMINNGNNMNHNRYNGRQLQQQQRSSNNRNTYGTDFGAGGIAIPVPQQQQQPLPFQQGGQFVPNVADQNNGGQFGQQTFVVPNAAGPNPGQFGGQPNFVPGVQFGQPNFVPNDHHGQFGGQPTFGPNVAGDQSTGQFGPTSQNQQNLFGPTDQSPAGGQFVPPQQQQQQQTTSFGGFYNQQQPQQQPDQFYPQAGFGPVPPPPPPLPPPIQSADVASGGGTFANPFQPFLQQSFNSAQQFQGGGSSQQVVPLSSNGGAVSSGGTGGFPLVPSTPTAAQQQQQQQFGTPIQPQQPQQYFGQYNQQEQQQVDNNNNNNNFNGAPPLYNPNGLNNQQQLNNNNNNAQEVPFAQPTAAGLNAVPPVVEQPLQRPRQLFIPVGGGSQEVSDKNLQNLVEPSPNNNNFLLLNKGGIGGVEVKKPFSPSGFIPGENGQTCPKQPNWEPCVPKEIANQRFRNCCARLGDGCSQLCSYDQNLSTIQLAVLTGSKLYCGHTMCHWCPVSRVGEMMVCASGNEDATACCQAFGVFESGFDHCRPYCNPSGGLPNDGMLAEKYRCLQKLHQIQKCFYLTQRP